MTVAACRVVCFFSLITSVPISLSAQRADSAIARCAALTNSVVRLRCYDAIAKRSDTTNVSPEARASASKKVGNWMVSDRTSPIDDSRTVVLAVEASEGRARFGQKPVLVLRCQSGQVNVYIDWHDFMDSDETTVATRVGTAPPERKPWTISTDGRATFFPDDDVALLDTLLLVDRLVAQATPYSESPVTAVFVVTGLADAVKPLREACPPK